MGCYIKNNSDCSFLVDDNDIIGRTILSTGSWESNIEEVFKNIVKSDYTTVNIGANMGYHTIKLGMISQKVIAFEPQRKMFNQLCSNIYLNSLDDKIDAYRLALGDVKEKARMASFEDNPFLVCGELSNFGGMSIPEDGTGEEIQIVTLDSLNISPDFILMDAEGYEHKILLGSSETLRESNPIILFECWSTQTDKMFHYLKSLGYGIYWRPDFVDNFIALHEEFRDYEGVKDKLKELNFCEFYFSYDKANIE